MGISALRQMHGSLSETTHACWGENSNEVDSVHKSPYQSFMKKQSCFLFVVGLASSLNADVINEAFQKLAQSTREIETSERE